MTIPWTAVQTALVTWASEATGLPATSCLFQGQGGGRPSRTLPYLEIAFLDVRSLGEDWTDREVNYIELADAEVEAVDSLLNTVTITGHAYQSGDGPLEMETDGVLPGGVPVQFFAIVIDEDTVKLAATAQLALAGTAIDLLDAGTGTYTVIDTDETLRVGEELELKTRGPRQAVISVQCFAGAPLSGDLAVGNDSPMARLERMIGYADRQSTIAALATAGVGVGAIDPVRSVGGFLGPATFEPRAVMQARLFLASEVEDFGSFVESVQATNSLTGTVTEIAL